MEEFGFTLTLREVVTAPSRKAVEAVNAVDKAAQKAQAALNAQARALAKVAQVEERARTQAARAAERAAALTSRNASRAAQAAIREHDRAEAIRVRNMDRARKAAEQGERARDRAVNRARATSERAAEREAAQSQKAHDKEVKQARARTSYTDDIRKAQDRLQRIRRDPEGFQRLTKIQKQLQDAQEKLGGRPTFLKGLKESLSGKLPNVASAAAIGTIIGEGVIKGAEFLIEAAHKVVDLVVEGFRKAIDEASAQQTLRLGERVSLGASGAKDFQEDVGRFSKLTGFDDDAIRGTLLKSRRAGFSQKAARSAFAAAADIAVGEGQGGNMGRVNELMESFTHIKLKGGVQERFLPGLGVDVKGFYKDLSRELKVSTEAAKKMAEEGKVDPQLLLNTIYRGVEQKQGGQIGTASAQYSQTFEARLAKVKNLPNEYFKAIVDAPGFNRLSEKLGSLLEQLDPDSEQGQRIVGALQDAFTTIADTIGKAFTPENIKAFTDDVVALVGYVRDLAADIAPIIEMLHTIQPYARGFIKYGTAIPRGIASGVIGAGEELVKMAGSVDTLSAVKPNDGVGPVPTPGLPGGGRPTVNMPVNINVAMHGAPGEDQLHANQRAGEHVAQVMTDVAEQARQHLGGGR